MPVGDNVQLNNLLILLRLLGIKSAKPRYTNGDMAAMLKELYSGDYMKALTYSSNPLLSMVKKDTQFDGKYMPVPAIYKGKK